MPGAFLLDRTIEPPWPSEQVRNAVECDTRWGCLVGREHGGRRSEEHTSELQSLRHLVCRLLLEKKKRRRGSGNRRRRQIAQSSQVVWPHDYEPELSYSNRPGSGYPVAHFLSRSHPYCERDD